MFCLRRSRGQNQTGLSVFSHLQCFQWIFSIFQPFFSPILSYLQLAFYSNLHFCTAIYRHIHSFKVIYS